MDLLTPVMTGCATLWKREGTLRGGRRHHVSPVIRQFPLQDAWIYVRDGFHSLYIAESWGNEKRKGLDQAGPTLEELRSTP